MKKKIPTEVYSRVVGYFRPVNQWNKGKKEEFRKRKEFVLDNLEANEKKNQTGESINEDSH